MPTTSTITGVEEVKRAMQERVHDLKEAFRASLFIVAGEVMTRDILPGVPVVTGTLRDSRFVTRTDPIELGFAADYAVVVHEVGEHRKFLQGPIATAAGRIPALAGARVEELANARVTLATAPATHPETPSFVPRARRRPTRAR